MIGNRVYGLIKLKRNFQCFQLISKQYRTMSIYPISCNGFMDVTLPNIFQNDTELQEEQYNEHNKDVTEFGLCAVPKNRRSKWPGRRRKYINWLKKDSVKPIQYDMCRNCGAPVQPQHVCLQCFCGPPRQEPMMWRLH